MLPLRAILRSHNVNYAIYADDTQSYLPFCDVFAYNLYNKKTLQYYDI